MPIALDELRRAHDLTKQIEKTVRQIAVYRAADKVLVDIHPQNQMLAAHGGVENKITLTAAEIGDRIIIALERRLAAMTAELCRLGIA